MADKLRNCFLINAPAGSGKTTQIKAMVQKCLADNPQDNILCITYTNRAAEELSKNFDAKNVFIGTIHSFLHSFMKRYFAHTDILNLYFEVYGERIQQRIANSEKDEHIEASNKKYEEKYGVIDFDTVKKNIAAISYNESPFSSLYYGGLSHDDLISFSKCVLDRFPIIRKRISLKYQYIFIDEYQDTMADVLKLFYESVSSSNTRLYLFGDRMQQIYKNYDGSFEKQFDTFDTTTALLTNYRSVTEVVTILNRIYNDSSLQQDNSSEMKAITPDFSPRVIVSENIQITIEEIKQSHPNTLVLYLLNKARFDSMEKYSYGKTYSAVDILTTSFNDNPDPLMKLLYCIVDIFRCHQLQKYGLIIQTLRDNKTIFCKDSWYIKEHRDKQTLFNNLKVIFSAFEDETKTIGDLLTALIDTAMVNNSYIEGIQADDENRMVFEVPAIELLRVIEYLNDPKVSTQHEVKGESHDSVIFVAEDSHSNPIVHMYRFFEMWGNLSVSLKSFNQFYYAYLDELFDLQISINMKIGDLNKASYSQYEDIVQKKVKVIMERFAEDPYFKFLCKEKYEQFLSKPGVTKAKDCLKESTVYGVLSAYKLFYVGCSRARKNLTILLDKSKIKGVYELQKSKFEELGFVVQ